MLDLASSEWSENVRPTISNLIESIDNYETIFLGYPIWNSHAPRIIYSFLDSFDFSNKTIIPFATDGSSSINNSVRELRNNYSSYNFEDGLRLTDSTIKNEENAKSEIERCLEDLNMINVDTEEYLYLNINDKKYPIKINDNTSSRDLISRLPLTFSFTNFSTNEKIAYLDNDLEINDRDRGADAKKGELNYYFPWGNLCLFYEDGRRSNDLINIGFMEDSIDEISEINNDFAGILSLN